MKTKRYKISFILNVDVDGLTEKQLKRVPRVIKKELISGFTDNGVLYNFKHDMDQDTEIVKSSVVVETLDRRK